MPTPTSRPTSRDSFTAAGRAPSKVSSRALSASPLASAAFSAKSPLSAPKATSRALSGKPLGAPQSFSAKAPPRDSFTPTRPQQRPAAARPAALSPSSLLTNASFSPGAPRAKSQVPSRALTSSFMDASTFSPTLSRPTQTVSARALRSAPLGTPNSFVSPDRAVSRPARSFQPFSKNDLLGQVQPAGASAATAAQDGLSTRGVMASRALAQSDLQRMDAYRDRLQEAARQHGVSSAVLAGIASRESRAGLALKESGFAKYDPAGFGVMQLDVTKNPQLASRKSTPADAFSQEHFNRAAGLLAKNMETVRAKHPDWSEVDVMRGAVAAYNFGPKNVQSLDKLDIGTTGNDYSGDVLARAQYYSERGF